MGSDPTIPKWKYIVLHGAELVSALLTHLHGGTVTPEVHAAPHQDVAAVAERTPPADRPMHTRTEQPSVESASQESTGKDSAIAPDAHPFIAPADTKPREEPGPLQELWERSGERAAEAARDFEAEKTKDAPEGAEKYSELRTAATSTYSDLAPDPHARGSGALESGGGAFGFTGEPSSPYQGQHRAEAGDEGQLHQRTDYAGEHQAPSGALESSGGAFGFTGEPSSPYQGQHRVDGGEEGQLHQRTDYGGEHRAPGGALEFRGGAFGFTGGAFVSLPADPIGATLEPEPIGAPLDAQSINPGQAIQAEPPTHGPALDVGNAVPAHTAAEHVVDAARQTDGHQPERAAAPQSAGRQPQPERAAIADQQTSEHSDRGRSYSTGTTGERGFIATDSHSHGPTK
jgi:hypothetical protein